MPAGLYYPTIWGMEPVVWAEVCAEIERKKTMTTKEDLNNWFSYHPPSPAQIPKFEKIRDGARAFSELVLENTPRCADQTAAIRQIREAVMTANAAIACNSLTVEISQLANVITFTALHSNRTISRVVVTEQELLTEKDWKDALPKPLRPFYDKAVGALVDARWPLKLAEQTLDQELAAAVELRAGGSSR